MMALNRSPEAVSPQHEFYLLYYYCSNLWPPGWGQFWPQGYHMNRIDIGPNIIVQGQMIKALFLLVSEKKNFKVFLLCSYVSNSWQRRRFSKILLFFSFWLPWQPELWLEFNLLNNFARASPKEHPCQVSSRLAQWFRRRRCLKKLWTTHDGHRTLGYHKSSPWALCAQVS